MQKSTQSKEETRGGAVQEQRDLWNLEQTSSQYTGVQSTKSLSTLLQELGPNGQKLLTTEEINTINETGQVTIGSRTIVFKDGLTIGNEYDKGNIKIGDEMTYKGTKDWIIFGKDNNGNVLLASKTPVENYEITYDAYHWLTYEDDLDAECASYGTTIQGKTITARSIRMEDINNVVEFTEPNFTTYKFTNDTEGNGQFANGKVNFYYPSLDASGNAQFPYFQKATITDTTVSAGSSDIPAKEFNRDSYWYGYDTSSSKYKLKWYQNGNYREDEIDLTTNLLKSENMQYVVETSPYYGYYIATKYIHVYDSGASFGVYHVNSGQVGWDSSMSLAWTNDTTAGDGAGAPYDGIRPIIVLPSNIEVVEISDGVYDIKY